MEQQVDTSVVEALYVSVVATGKVQERDLTGCLNIVTEPESTLSQRSVAALTLIVDLVEPLTQQIYFNAFTEALMSFVPLEVNFRPQTNIPILRARVITARRDLTERLDRCMSVIVQGNSSPNVRVEKLLDLLVEITGATQEIVE